MGIINEAKSEDKDEYLKIKNTTSHVAIKKNPRI